MQLIERNNYRLWFNPRAGVVWKLNAPSDTPEVNLVHCDAESAFGSLVYSTLASPPEFHPAPDSPTGGESVVITEFHAFARCETEAAGQAVCRNRLLDYELEYRFADDYFELHLAGRIPEADMIGLDLPVALMDLRQYDPADEQFTLQSFFRAKERNYGYVFLARPHGPGLLISATGEVAGWRLKYRPDNHAATGFQFLARFPEKMDAMSASGRPVDLTIRVRFAASAAAGLAELRRELGIPELVLPVLSARAGEYLPYAAPAGTTVTLTAPDGEISTLPPAGRLLLPREGFYQLQAQGVSAYAAEAVLHAGADWRETLRRAADHLTPRVGYCAEAWYWVEGLCVNRLYGQGNVRQDSELRAALDVMMQGVEPKAKLPEVVPAELENTLEREGDCYLYVPAPKACEMNGRRLSPFHVYRWERIQDGFEFVRLCLLAAETYGEDAYYEQAVRIAEAHLEDHLSPDGAIRCIREWDRLPIDYTTVIAPLQVMVELYGTMKARGESERAEKLRRKCLAVADFLVERGLEFPTEGASVHLRWTEDGSIACTALSLLSVYHFIVAEPRYLEAARRVMAYHRSWELTVPDARIEGSSYRYWETQWENDGEGRAINAGHAWTLWQAEALFLLGTVDRDAGMLLKSYNGFRTNLCKYFPDGHCCSCFTPDYLPMRPRRMEICHTYPKTPDRSLAFYLWPRWRVTWAQTAAVLSPESCGLPASTDMVVLNGRAELAADGVWEVTADAPDWRVLYVAPGIRARAANGRTVELIELNQIESTAKRTVEFCLKH